MSDPQLYSLIYLLADSALLSEEASVSFTRDAGNQVAKTVAKGWAGITPGVGSVQLDVTNMIPANGQEFDAGPYMASGTPIEMGLLCAGKQATFKGYIMGDSFKHSVGSEAAYDFKVEGAMTQFE